MSSRSYDLTARVRDVVLSAVGLVVLSPVIAGTAVAVARSLGRPVLFRQRRPGKDGRQFTLTKFRTLLPEDSVGTASDADRLTPAGAKIRATSLDELPSLWNVLRGDMSLVGPRPLLVSYLDRYSPVQARRHEVRPGLTGWAQVNGRNAVSWDDRLAMDVWYVDHRSHALDARILWMTVRAVLRRDGISAEGQATMPEFLGSLSGNDDAGRSPEGHSAGDLTDRRASGAGGR